VKSHTSALDHISVVRNQVSKTLRNLTDVLRNSSSITIKEAQISDEGCLGHQIRKQVQPALEPLVLLSANQSEITIYENGQKPLAHIGSTPRPRIGRTSAGRLHACATILEHASSPTSATRTRIIGPAKSYKTSCIESFTFNENGENGGKRKDRSSIRCKANNRFRGGYWREFSTSTLPIAAKP